MNAPALAAMMLLRLYQRMRPAHTRGCCIYTPTCSSYALTAIERFGLMRGCRLAVSRIRRCGGNNAGGYDPVLEQYTREQSSAVVSLNVCSGNTAPKFSEGV